MPKPKVTAERFKDTKLLKAGVVVRTVAALVNEAPLLTAEERHTKERYESLVARYNELDTIFGYWTLGIPDIQAIQSALVEELQLLEQVRGKK